MDPVTLVVTAVALGASTGLTETVSSSIKDAYTALKSLLTRHKIDVTGIEKKPDSTVQQEAVKEVLVATPDAVDEPLLDAARALTDAVTAQQPTAAAVIGVDLRQIQAEFIRVTDVTARGAGATGVRIEHSRIDQGIDISHVTADGFSGEEQDPSYR